MVDTNRVPPIEGGAGEKKWKMMLEHLRLRAQFQRSFGPNSRQSYPAEADRQPFFA
jgi:hypothetical protein